MAGLSGFSLEWIVESCVKTVIHGASVTYVLNTGIGQGISKVHWCNFLITGRLQNTSEQGFPHLKANFGIRLTFL